MYLYISSHLKRVSTMDSSWVAAAAPGLQAHNSPAWLGVYLAVCKLLDQVYLAVCKLLNQVYLAVCKLLDQVYLAVNY